MIVRRTGAVFGCAFGASLLMHAGLFAWVDYALEERRRLLDANQLEAVTIALPPELLLGLESVPEASPTWLGHEAAQEQFAERSETEQAAFAVELTSPSPPPVDPVQMVHRIETSELTSAIRNVSKKMSESAKNVAREIRRIRALVQIAPTSDGARPSEEKTLEHVEQESANSNAKVQTTESAAPAAPAVERNSEVGTPADKQSTPSSIIDVPPDQWKLGRPLASHGLELKPRRPTLTILTMLTAAPGNPLCAIYFNRDGIAVKAAILRSSGDHRVDSAILASLYGWRASGKALETVADEQPLQVTIRILLTRQRVDVDQEA